MATFKKKNAREPNINAQQPNKLAKTTNDAIEAHALKRRCYICLDLMKCPLQICSEGHCACAGCLAMQIGKTELKATCKVGSDFIPMAHIVWPTQITCGICKEKGSPKFPGSYFVDLIVETAKQIVLNCPFCENADCLRSKLLGKHILTCDWQMTECVYCKQEVQLRALDKHFKEECQQLSCIDCNNLKMNGKSLGEHKKTHADVKKMCILLRKISTASSFKQFAFNNLAICNAAVSIIASPVDASSQVIDSQGYSSEEEDSEENDSSLEEYGE